MFEKIVTLTPAFDRRDPNPVKNYGIHSAELRMVLRGPKGATQFVLYTGWYLPHVQKEHQRDANFFRPLPADLGYHALEPRYPGQDSSECHLLPGGQCYYDGSGLNAEQTYQTLLTKGSDGVWAELEAFYHEIFDEAEAVSSLSESSA